MFLKLVTRLIALSEKNGVLKKIPNSYFGGKKSFGADKDEIAEEKKEEEMVEGSQSRCIEECSGNKKSKV